MTQKIEQSQRQERVAAWNRRAECDLAAFQNSPKQTYQAEKARDRKLCANLEEAIRRSGLQDGMTVSFHHAFRGGDLTVNMVMDVIAKMGFKNLTLASSSLSDCHAPLVEHIRQGVVTRIYTSGLRGPLAEEISRGLLAEPVQIHSHGGRVHLVQSGELISTWLSSASRPAMNSVMPTATPVKPAAAPSAMQWLMPTTQSRS